MKYGGILNKHFCKKKSNIPNETAEIANFHFSHYKSMETISYHSNQNSYPIGIENLTFVEGNVLSKYEKFQLLPPYGFRKGDFLNIFVVENLPFISPRQPIKFSDLDKSHKKRGGLLNKHFCKNNSYIPSDSAEIVNFHFYENYKLP